MIKAIKNNKIVYASPKNIAKCPLCKQIVIAKCGEIKTWHWAHKSNIDCDDWSEPESQWHINWKNEFPEKQQEVIIRNHIADIKTKDGLIIELQHSPLSAEKIRDREEFYGNMIWLLDGKTIGKNLNLREKDYGFSFRWKHPPKSWWNAKKPIYFDLHFDRIFLIKKLYSNIPCGGYGILITKQQFLNEVKNGKGKTNK
ncbi:MAG TPA: competence protein CoiA family protein [Candidatus Paceibacterota bacterium]|nr:competence protein CoiA family protein [Candidatus Paceibacterota bacterium]